MENIMKLIGLEWRKRREICEKSCPQSHFSEKTHKTQFQKQKSLFFGKTKPAGIPPSLGEGGQGAGPGPNVNGKGQGAGPGPNVNKIGPIWSIQYGRILVGFGPKSGQQKSKNIFFPKCPNMLWKWFL